MKYNPTPQQYSSNRCKRNEHSSIFLPLRISVVKVGHLAFCLDHGQEMDKISMFDIIRKAPHPRVTGRPPFLCAISTYITGFTLAPRSTRLQLWQIELLWKTVHTPNVSYAILICICDMIRRSIRIESLHPGYMLAELRRLVTYVSFLSTDDSSLAYLSCGYR